LPAWVSAAIPWRWRREGAGGVVLMLEGAVVSVAIVNYIRDALSAPAFKTAPRFPPPYFGALLLVGLPPLVAGILFLASWWRPRRAGTPQKSA